jgi:hypothetical protein
LEHQKERGTKINSVYYNEMLRDQLKPVTRTKRWGLPSKGVTILHCLHTAAHTVERLHQLNSEVLKHPLYGPDLAPFGYHLSGPL